MSLQDDDTKQVPLVERLRYVPIPAKLNMEWGTGHFPAMTSHPVGRLCHAAADELDRLTTELAAVQLERDALARDMTTIAAREVPKGCPVADFAKHALADAPLATTAQAERDARRMVEQTDPRA
jgi:hypothetical protein